MGKRTQNGNIPTGNCHIWRKARHVHADYLTDEAESENERDRGRYMKRGSERKKEKIEKCERELGRWIKLTYEYRKSHSLSRSLSFFPIPTNFTFSRSRHDGKIYLSIFLELSKYSDYIYFSLTHKFRIYPPDHSYGIVPTIKLFNMRLEMRWDVMRLNRIDVRLSVQMQWRWG